MKEWKVSFIEGGKKVVLINNFTNAKIVMSFESWSQSHKKGDIC